MTGIEGGDGSKPRIKITPREPGVVRLTPRLPSGEEPAKVKITPRPKRAPRVILSPRPNLQVVGENPRPNSIRVILSTEEE